MDSKAVTLCGMLVVTGWCGRVTNQLHSPASGPQQGEAESMDNCTRHLGANEVSPKKRIIVGELE